MKFWQELRRRRVFRMTGLYIVGAWVVIQVAEVSFEAWGVPDSALRFLFIAAFACFPVALVFSWRYDVTSTGIKRTEKVDDATAVDLGLNRTDYLVLAALVLVGGLIVFNSFTRIQEQVVSGQAPEPGLAAPDNSIAVLPFKNLDINPETGYFSDGITEEILNRLAGFKKLHVLASNSSFAFRDDARSPADIIAELGVRYLLQGSIRREQNQVRITARLIDAGGFQVWNDQYDRQIEGLFAIQAEIAGHVAGQVVNEIVPLNELPEGRTTTNMEAYDQYLVGKALLDSRIPNWREQAKAAFQRAMELDPDFAPPYAGMAKAITVNTPRGPNWEEGKRLAEKAVELDPDLAEAHSALGLMLMVARDLNAASLSLRKALELNPSLGYAYNTLAMTLERMGQFEESVLVQQKGLSVDPLNPPLVANIHEREARAGNYERAEQLLLRLLRLPEPPDMAYFVAQDFYFSLGRFTDLLDVTKRANRKTVEYGDPCCLDWLAWTYGSLGMAEEADYWLELALRDADPVSMESMDLTYNLLRTRGSDSVLGRQLLQWIHQTEFDEEKHPGFMLAQYGMVNIYMGNHAAGAAQLDRGIRLYQAQRTQSELQDTIDISAIPGSPEDVTLVIQNLAFAYQQTGRQGEAQTILEGLAELHAEWELPENALLHALSGNPEAALAAQRAMQRSKIALYYGPNAYYEIIHDPLWAKTIKAPGFQELLAEMKAEVDRQRAIVEAIEAEHDFRAEMAELMVD